MYVSTIIAAVMLLSNVRCQSDTQYHVNIAVISPPDTLWEHRVAATLQQLAVSRDSPSLVSREVFYFTKPLPTNLEESREVIRMLESKSVAVMIGPYNPFLALIAEDISVPYLSLSIPDSSTPQHHTAQTPRQTTGGEFVTIYDVTEERTSHTFHFLPHTDVIHTAVADLVQAFEWREQVAVIYDSDEGLKLLGEIMKLQVVNGTLKIHGWALSDSSTELDIREHLFTIRRQEISQIVVHCKCEVLEDILRVALRLSMLSSTYTWVAAGLEQRVDMTPYLDSSVNYTTFRLSNNGSELSRAVTHDAVTFTLAVIDRYMSDHNASICVTSCRRRYTIRGRDLRSTVRQVSLVGETGEVNFTEGNYKTNVKLTVMSLINQSIEQFGRWTQEGASWNDRLETRPYSEIMKYITTDSLRHKDVKIVTLVEKPFVMRKKNCDHCVGNDRYEGFLVDLIKEIANHMNIRSYTLYESPDGNYGACTDGEWNGMIKELLIGNASMCLGAISITSERESAVDFSKPYKQKMFNILMKKPKEKSSIFQFLWPLSPIVWILIVSSLVFSSLVLYFIDKISPSQKRKKSGRFNLIESLWFMYGSLVGAGTEIVPKTLSGRLLTAAWWFFSLILVSSYTANLAAFLTVTKIETPIKTVADLEKQSQIRYGTVKNTYASSMFRDSKLDIFKKMHTFMTEISPSSMVDTSDIGFQKVKEENYAFIWDAPINKYESLHSCDVMVVGEPFDEKGYGIGVPPRAPYRDAISMAILSLSESGAMQSLENKWWGDGPCDEFRETSTTSTKELDLRNVAGIYLVLAVGAGLAFIVSLLELLVRKTLQDTKKQAKQVEAETDHEENSAINRSPLFTNNEKFYFNKESNL